MVNKQKKGCESERLDRIERRLSRLETQLEDYLDFPAIEIDVIGRRKDGSFITGKSRPLKRL